MKKLFLSILTILVLAGCQIQDLHPEYKFNDSDIYASMESIGSTKTSMDSDKNVLWSAEDQVVAFLKTTLGQKYQIKDQYVGQTSGGFSKVADSESGDDLVSGQELDHNIVLYPYSDLAWCAKGENSSPTKSYKVEVVLPETQTYAENSFANGAFPMIAVSSDNQFTFRNICGGIKLQFKGVDKIKSIKFEGRSGELISGKASVVGHVDGSAPAITMSSTASGSVTLDCSSGVQLSPDTPVTFIIAVPPVAFPSGMKITVTDTDGLSRTLTNTHSNTIKKSSLLTFPVITYTQEGVFEIPEGTLTSYEIPSDGGRIEIPVTTNQDYEVVIPEAAQEWVTLAKTKALREEMIYLNIDENTLSEDRSADVLVTSGGETLQVITISQTAVISGSQRIDYIDEYGVNQGPGVKIGETLWAPVNCGYHATDYKYGKLYQWGRKYGQGYDKNDASVPELMDGGEFTFQNAVSDIYSNVFFTSSKSPYDWVSGLSYNLWNSGKESSPEKTEHDPCPNGWRVPTETEMGRLNDNYSDWVVVEGQRGRYFSGTHPYNETAPQIFLPASGYRAYDGDAYGRNNYGYYWVSAANYQSSPDYFRFDYNVVMIDWGNCRSWGYSIRCVQE